MRIVLNQTERELVAPLILARLAKQLRTARGRKQGCHAKTSRYARNCPCSWCVTKRATKVLTGRVEIAL